MNRFVALLIAGLLAAGFLTASVGAQSTQAGTPAGFDPEMPPVPERATGPGLWMPEEASNFSAEVDFVYLFITWLSLVFFVAIVATMIYFMVKYRRVGHTPPASSSSHNTPLELVWTIVPLILVIAIFYVGMQGYIRFQEPPAGSYDVQVTASKWNWNFRYANGSSDSILYVPVGEPVRLVMKSEDVLHSLYIPAFRVKQDVVPGRYTMLWFEATEPGMYDLVCAEYCGTDHSRMTTKVIAYEREDFNKAMFVLARVFEKASDAELPWLALERIYPRCKSCHSLNGLDGIGPTWVGLWERTVEGRTVFNDDTQLSELLGNGQMFGSPEDYIHRSILIPQEKIVEPFSGQMPSFKGQLNDRQIQAIIMLMKDLDQYVDENGNSRPRPESLGTEPGPPPAEDAAAEEEAGE